MIELIPGVYKKTPDTIEYTSKAFNFQSKITIGNHVYPDLFKDKIEHFLNQNLNNTEKPNITVHQNKVPISALIITYNEEQNIKSVINLHTDLMLDGYSDHLRSILDGVYGI